MSGKIIKILGHDVVFENAEEVGFVVTVPHIDCVTEGDTMEEAMKMAVDLIKCVNDYGKIT
jgi:predicted RNase H-like HicB family nuclease